MMHWLIENWVEIIGVITGLLYIFLSVKQNIWCWPFGIISSVLYVLVFFKTKIYADMLVQVYYVIMGFYGWIHWAKIDAANSNNLVLRFNVKEWASAVLVTALIFVAISQFLIYFTDSPTPWVDAFITSLSFTATWMLARKILEHWLIWVLVNIVSIGLYYYRGLYITIILFLVYTLLALLGYFEWKKEWNRKKAG